MLIEENEEQSLDTESSASEGASLEPSSKEGSETEVSTKEESSGETKIEDTTPFHEHPRFKELVEQKNQALSAQKALEERYAAMEAQLKKISDQPKVQTQADKDELIEDLRKIDPRLASRLEAFSKALPQMENLQKQLQQYEQQQVVQQAVQTINQLHEQNKVSPELKGFINNEIDRLYMQGNLKNIKDVPGAYKAIHDQYSKFMESIKRTTLEGYVPSKKADAKTPTSQPKGKAVSHAPKSPTFSKDPEVAKQQIVSRYLKQTKAEADI